MGHTEAGPARAASARAAAVPPRPGCRLEAWSEPVLREWDELAVSTGAPPFSRPGWIRAMHQAFFPGSRLALQTVRDGDVLTAVVPLLVTRLVAASPTNWHTPSFGLVARDDATRRHLSDGLLTLPVHRVDLRFLPGRDAELLLERARARRELAVSRGLQSSPFVTVDRPWAEVRASFSRNLRRDARRSERRLAQHGSVTWELHDGQESLERLLTEGFAVEAAGWKGQGGTAIRSRADTLRFYTLVARWAAERDLLRLCFLRVDGRAVAFDYYLQQDGALFSLKTGYLPELASCSPGTVSFLRLLEHASADRELRTVHLLGHATPWKNRLATGTSEQYQVTAFVHPRSRHLAHASARLGGLGREAAVRHLPEAVLDSVTRLRERRARSLPS